MVTEAAQGAFEYSGSKNEDDQRRTCSTTTPGVAVEDASVSCDNGPLILVDCTLFLVASALHGHVEAAQGAFEACDSKNEDGQCGPSFTATPGVALEDASVSCDS